MKKKNGKTKGEKNGRKREFWDISGKRQVMGWCSAAGCSRDGYWNVIISKGLLTPKLIFWGVGICGQHIGKLISCWLKWPSRFMMQGQRLCISRVTGARATVFKLDIFAKKVLKLWFEQHWTLPHWSTGLFMLPHTHLLQDTSHVQL